MEESAEHIVLEAERAWSRLLTGDSPETAATLYTADAVFFGSKPRLYFGQQDIAQYFADVPAGHVLEVLFSNRRVARLSSDLLVTAAFATFRYSGSPATEAIYRITWTLLKSARGWKIAQHHASALQ